MAKQIFCHIVNIVFFHISMTRKNLLAVLIIIILSGCNIGTDRPSVLDKSEESQIVISKLSELLIESPELTLDRVRDVAVLNNDETLIGWINDDKNEVFVTDLDGKFVSKFGSRGNGPNEFERISALGFTNNNDLITYDGHQDLFKIFDIDGTLLNIHEGIMRDGLFIRDPRIFSDGEYFYLGIQERSKSGPENHWKSHTIAKISMNEGLVNIFGYMILF